MAGVAPIDFDINSPDYNTCGWYIYCGDSSLYSGPPYNYENKDLGLSKVNDEIIIVMNMKKRTLKFIINNEDKGDSYTDIPIDKPIFPVVLLYYQNDFNLTDNGNSVIKEQMTGKIAILPRSPDYIGYNIVDPKNEGF